ncbi:uracil phosphoribosyltransferase-domain-containing protein [Suillus tomentosus]|nr:uracil phosphoribosyltransferase-domain-containing protein [Suillus tomentosus]
MHDWVWDRISASPEHRARCKLSVIAQAISEFNHTIDPRLLVPYNSHFYPDATNPAYSLKTENRRRGTPFIAGTFRPLEHQIIQLGMLDKWDYCLRKLFVLTSTGRSPGSDTLRASDWAAVVGAFDRWPFAPEVDSYILTLALANTKVQRFSLSSRARHSHSGATLAQIIAILFRTAAVYHLGLYREKVSLQPVEYYSKLPPVPPIDTYFILNPLVATGGTACAALVMIIDWGVAKVSFLLLSAQQESFYCALDTCSSEAQPVYDTNTQVPGFHPIPKPDNIKWIALSSAGAVDRATVVTWKNQAAGKRSFEVHGRPCPRIPPFFEYILLSWQPHYPRQNSWGVCNQTVIFTIHQPRSNIVALFDRLVLLAHGKMPCPPGFNISCMLDLDHEARTPLLMMLNNLLHEERAVGVSSVRSEGRPSTATSELLEAVRSSPSGNSTLTPKLAQLFEAYSTSEVAQSIKAETKDVATAQRGADASHADGELLPEPDYVEQQIGHEQFIWAGDDVLIYAGNVRDVGGSYSYSKDMQVSIGVSTRSSSATQRRAWKRRLLTPSLVVDLNTGTLHHIWHGLTYDLSTIYAPMGTYPSFAFTPSSSSPGIIIWAAGQMWHVPLAYNSEGELVAAATATNNINLTPKVIPFTAQISKKLAETRRMKTDVRKFESGPQRVRAFTQLALDESGEHAVFAGAGQTWVQVLGDSLINPTTLDPIDDANFVETSKPAQRIPHLHSSAVYYSPSFVPASSFILHPRWDNIIHMSHPLSWSLDSLKVGVKTGGDVLTGDVVATAQTGVWVGEITLPSHSYSQGTAELTNLRYVQSSIDPSDVVKLSFGLFFFTLSLFGFSCLSSLIIRERASPFHA